MPIEAPYGSWKSPITVDLITGQSISLLELAIDGQDLYWIESRPKEGGRYTIMRRTSDGRISECTPPEFYSRTTVHEYGGGAFTVADGIIYFANFRDQHLFVQRVGKQPQLLTPTNGNRYADLIVDGMRQRLICIREDHTVAGEAVNTIVAIPLDGNNDGQVLAAGNDFYSSPRLNPDGTHMAYLTWNHPNMPWDGCELWVEDVGKDGKLANAQRVAGSATESVFQPEWSPDGVLHFVVEASGWWNLYRWDGAALQNLHPMDAEFGRPQWVFDEPTYGFASPTRIVCSYSQNGIWHLAWLHPATGELTTIESGYTDISDVFEVTVDSGYLSVPQSISFPTDNGQKAHGIYYPPANKDFAASQAELPPLLVISHGGPTGATETAMRYIIQFWTSRGFAMLDVNYGGSTGYGRDYRQRLNGNWGIVDVADCCNGALYLAEKGLADRDRLAIRGRSAGGYTTLACLAFRPGIFKAGASHFGLSELAVFATDTHKFELRYLNSLVGPYPARRDLYIERSPINFTNNMSAPLIMFQGDEDPIVSPSQSEMMLDALRKKGVPVAYLLFQGEQHGFRRAENIQRSLEAELYFYSKIFGFTPADPMEPVHIENLKSQ